MPEHSESTQVPQPSPERIVTPMGHPLVVGITPGQPELVALTAATWARALGGVPLHFGYVDRSRVVVAESSDGTVRHAPIDPDSDDGWQHTSERIEQFLRVTLDAQTTPWTFHYLAGPPGRALTHLARAVDAAAIVVGAQHPSASARLRDFVSGSVALNLSRHQHRPVVVVPLSVVDWQAPAPW
ncbi:MAG: universal stress protein [Propionicimonas sp.]|nr:universal stress protein [Propionicimonas sp.]